MALKGLENMIFGEFFGKTPGGRVFKLVCVFFKSLVGENFGFGHMAERLKRLTETCIAENLR